MAYHGFVEHNGMYAILMDKEDVEMLGVIIGNNSAGPASEGGKEFLSGMFRDDAVRRHGIPLGWKSKMGIMNRDPTAAEDSGFITNWYIKEK